MGAHLLSEADLLCGDGAQTYGHVAGNTGKGLEIRGAHIVADLLQVDGVKLALGGADAAAYAHVFIHNYRAAAKATLGLFLQLLLGEYAAQILEGLLRLSGSAAGGLLPGSGVEGLDGDGGGGDVQGLVIPAVAAEVQTLARMDKAMSALV